jgi:hypothetical protein
MHDIPAFYAQYVKNLQIDNFSLEWDTIPYLFFTHGIKINYFESIEYELPLLNTYADMVHQ